MGWLPTRWRNAWRARRATADEQLVVTSEILRRWAVGSIEHGLGLAAGEPLDPDRAFGELFALAPWLAHSEPRGGRSRRGRPRYPEKALGLEKSFRRQLWPLAGERAWRQQEFARQVAEPMLATLRRRHLMIEGRPTGPVPAPWPVPRVATHTWWLLVVAVAVPGVRVGGRFGSRALARRLDGVGREVLAGAPGGWAGFWDQWLVGEVLMRFGVERDIPIVWHPMLHGMPWLRHFDALADPLADALAQNQPTEPCPPPTHDDGQAERPGWLHPPPIDRSADQAETADPR